MKAKLELIYTCRLLVPEPPADERRVISLGHLAAHYDLKAARSEGKDREAALELAKLYRNPQLRLLIEKGKG